MMFIKAVSPRPTGNIFSSLVNSLYVIERNVCILKQFKTIPKHLIVLTGGGGHVIIVEDTPGVETDPLSLIFSRTLSSVPLRQAVTVTICEGNHL